MTMAALAQFYPWLKALHIVSVIAWMAGLLYLPRLFVYHCDAPPGSDKSETFKVMERRLLRGIMNPAMAATYLFAVLLVIVLWNELLASSWFYAKLLLVVALTWFHQALARWRKEFAADANRRPARFYRIANEVPTAIMVAIVILAVVRPF
ncbi:MAG: protoporphyrinogen oxidase HemJ [Dongiaceae bacterium]